MARRGHNEGSVYQLPDGRWRGSVSLGWAEGKRKRRYITRSTRSAVARELRRLVDDAQAGRLPARRPPTVGEWMQLWLNDVASATVRDSTLQRYRQEVRLHIAPALGDVRLDRLQPQQLAAFYRDAQSHLSAGSVRRLHAVLRRSLTVAQRWGHIAVNPATLVEPPPLQQNEVRPLSVSEAHSFLAAAGDSELAARWVLGLSLGLRQGEVLGLHWEDIDLS